MSQQSLDLRRALQIVRRHRVLVGVLTALGCLAGAALTLVSPPMLTSQAVVVLSPTMHDTRTQVVIAGSNPVLVGALRRINLGISPETLRSRIRVGSPAYNIISISAQGHTAGLAEGTANAVAASYTAYLRSPGIPGGPGGAKLARVLERATNATSTPLAIRLLVTAGLGALAGLLIGVIAALAISRSDRRLRERDEIAESIEVPVLASIDVAHPSGTTGWKKLLKEYEPGAVDAWRLRKALQHLGLDLGLADGKGSGSSLTVVSLSHDTKALALGPQLAVFAASLGMPTALVIGPQQDANAAATLRAACAAWQAPPERLRNLRVTVSDPDGSSGLPDAVLAVVIAVVDGKAPQFPAAIRTTGTVLGVSAGAATADQLARVAASAAADGRHIAGILVADSDPADHTTGRLPELARSAQRTIPARTSGMTTGTRR